MYDYLIVGAGFAGSVMAERVATQLNKKVILIEKRNHIGGNAYDEYDEHGILVHRYGPHILHTNSKGVFDYLSQFTEWIPYEHKVLAIHNNEFYNIPINRLTINKYFNKSFTTDKEVMQFLEKIREKKKVILNSEDFIVNQVGRELFEAFFKNYTFKQWNKYPHELSPSICGRIPVHMNDDCRYFSDKYQFMPKDGYTKMFEKMLCNPNIDIVLSTDYKEVVNDIKFDKIIYTGPVDYYYDYKHGKLPYRSIKFEWVNIDTNYYQPCAQINEVSEEVPFTRVIEHKYLSNQQTDSTTISREYPQHEGEPYYPIPTNENHNLFKKYEVEANKLNNVFFCGRLAEYQYYNMDQVTAKTFKIFEKIANGR